MVYFKVISHAALEGYIINTIIIILYAKMTLTLFEILMNSIAPVKEKGRPGTFCLSCHGWMNSQLI